MVNTLVPSIWLRYWIPVCLALFAFGPVWSNAQQADRVRQLEGVEQLEPVEVDLPERRESAARTPSSERGFDYDLPVPSGQPFSDFSLTPGEVVSATGRVTNLAAVPAAISVVENRGIAAQGNTGLSQMVRSVPGTWSGGYDGNVFKSYISMRGFSQTPAAVNRVALMIDGRSLQLPKSTIHSNFVFPEIIERVEVMRGDGTIQFGNKAIGGAVNTILKKPRQHPGIYYGAEGRSWHGQREWGSINLVRGPVAAGIFLGHYGEEGFRLYGGDGTNAEVLPRPGPWGWINVMESVNWKITPRLSFDTFHFYSHQRLAATEAVELDRWERRDIRNVTKAVADGGPEERWDTITVLNLHYDGGRLGALDIIGSRRLFDDKNNSWVFNRSKGAKAVYSRWTDFGLSLKYTRTDRYSIIRNDLTIGSDLYDGRYGQEEQRVVGSGTSADPYQLEHRNETSLYRDTLSYYFLNQTRFWDRIIVGLGYRTEGYEFKDLYYNYRKSAGGTLNIGVNSRRIKDNKSASQYSLNLVYDRELGSSVYYKHSRTYRFPVVNEVINTSHGSTSHPNPIFYLDPEEGTLEEVGIRHWFTKNIYASLIYYELDMDNEILREWDISLPTPKYWYTNVPLVSHDGIEFEGMIRLTPRWTLKGSYTRQKVIWRTSNINPAKDPPGRLADAWVPLSPPQMYHLSLAYDNSDWGFAAMMSYDYHGKRYFQGDDANLQPEMDEIRIGNIAVSQTVFDGLTTLFFGVNNINDLKYSYGSSYYVSGGSPVFQRYPGAGRTYYAGIKGSLDFYRMKLPTTSDLRRMQKRLYGSFNEGLATVTGMGGWIRNAVPFAGRSR